VRFVFVDDRRDRTVTNDVQAASHKDEAHPRAVRYPGRRGQM
jgi:hypothetical protein